MDKVKGMDYTYPMTNFILDDGSVVDIGQEWVFTLPYRDGDAIGTVQELHPKLENMSFTFSFTDTDTEWKIFKFDTPWSDFSAAYNLGNICRHNRGYPNKRVNPHAFI